MDREPRDGQHRDQDADWIFAIDDPHSLPTDRLPDRAAFDRYATPLLARRGAAPSLPAVHSTSPSAATALAARSFGVLIFAAGRFRPAMK